MANKYSDANLGSGGDKTALVAGQYGDKLKAGLEVVNYIGSKETKEPGLVRHSFLVASTNGVVGTAFLAFNLRNEWLEEGMLALAFNKPEWTDEAVLKAAKNKLAMGSLAKCRGNNVPEENLMADADKVYENTLTQARISIGTIFRLQDWRGVDRDPSVTLGSLVGTRFGGKVDKSNLAPQPSKEPTTEVVSIFSKHKE